MKPETGITGPVQGKGADSRPLPSLPSPVALPPLEQVWEYIRASKAENTLRGYSADWRDFCAWSEAHGLSPLPAASEAVAAYIAECAGHLKPGSIQRRLNAIAEAHKSVGLESPTHHATVANTMKGIRRIMGTASTQKAAALTDDIRAMIDTTDAGTIGLRDGAIILLGFAGAFRRSELVGLDVEDCAFGKEGLTVTLRRSKTDQQGAGRKIVSPTVRTQGRARCECFRPGLNRQASLRGRCSAPSIDTGRCNRAGCPVSTWHESSRSWL